MDEVRRQTIEQITPSEKKELEDNIFKFIQLLSERLEQGVNLTDGTWRAGIKSRRFILKLTIQKVEEWDAKPFYKF